MLLRPLVYERLKFWAHNYIQYYAGKSPRIRHRQYCPTYYQQICDHYRVFQTVVLFKLKSSLCLVLHLPVIERRGAVPFCVAKRYEEEPCLSIIRSQPPKQDVELVFGGKFSYWFHDLCPFVRPIGIRIADGDGRYRKNGRFNSLRCYLFVDKSLRWFMNSVFLRSATIICVRYAEERS